MDEGDAIWRFLLEIASVLQLFHVLNQTGRHIRGLMHIKGILLQDNWNLQKLNLTIFFLLQNGRLTCSLNNESKAPYKTEVFVFFVPPGNVMNKNVN